MYIIWKENKTDTWLGLADFGSAPESVVAYFCCCCICYYISWAHEHEHNIIVIKTSGVTIIRLRLYCKALCMQQKKYQKGFNIDIVDVFFLLYCIKRIYNYFYFIADGNFFLQSYNNNLHVLQLLYWSLITTILKIIYVK